jgi:hypothetical protein
MIDNRYAPPGAFVGEIADEVRPAPPSPVVWAVRLLWATTVFAIPQFYFAAMRAPSSTAMIVGLIFEAVVTAFACYLYVSIHRGKNWARIITLIFTVLSTALMVFGPSLPSSSTFERVIGIINTVSDIVCMYLVFAPPGSAWFKSRRTEVR